ncbi:MAG: hypothetical protein AAF961_01170 [Planctomycetota bacterium]
MAGPAAGGVSASLRLESVVGTRDDASANYVTEVNDGGELFAQISGVFASGIKIMIDARASAGSDTIDSAEIAVTKLTVNGQDVVIPGFVRGDFKNEGRVDGDDYLELQREVGAKEDLVEWENALGASSTIELAAFSAAPEPATAVMLALVSIAAAMRHFFSGAAAKVA